MQKLLFTSLFFLSLFVHAQGETKCSELIFGKWTNEEFGYQMVLNLYVDGNCDFDGVAMRYNCNGDKLNFYIQGQQESYAFELLENDLFLDDARSGVVINMKRASASSQAEQIKPEVAITQVKESVQSNELKGIWVGYNERIEFGDNSSCIYNGMDLKYANTDKTITLIADGGSISFLYELSKDQLILKADGKTLTYTRQGAKIQTNTSEVSGNKRVAQELVGRWCWTNVNATNSGGSTSETCITLNADGTYKYYSERSMDANTDAFFVGTNSQSSDFGTWSYDGVRIYYTSQNGQGTGSYLLEKRNHPKNGDPMIVLDGETYVTYYQKNPW